MDGEVGEKMKNILCPVHSKKIQFLNLEDGTDRFFICSDCLTKDKKYCMDRMDYFISIEDFKSGHLSKMKRELDMLRDSIATHMIHIENHIKNGEVSIEGDYEKISKALIEYVKMAIRQLKTSLTHRFRESNKVNLKALEILKEQINRMLDDGNGVIVRLNSTMNRQIENSSVLENLLQGNSS